MKKEAAFSGLEAAIVLIAFVVVAAVFSYVMLGAGFFATQKSQEVTYSGIKQATSNLVLDGQIYGVSTTFQNMIFWLSIPEGGQAQSLATADLSILFTKNDGAVWDQGSRISTAPDSLLSPGEKAKITFTIRNNDPAVQSVGPGDWFTLEIKPKTGASTLISKNLGTGYIGGPIY